MMLEITGNEKFFEAGDLNPQKASAKLDGLITLEKSGPIDLSFKNKSIYTFPNRLALIEIAKHIRGNPLRSWGTLFAELGYQNIDISLFGKITLQSENIVKSLLLVYIWLDLCILSPSSIDIKSMIYDEFAVDSSNSPGPVNDIYFLPLDMQSSKQIIDKLFLLNLLCHLSLSLDSGKLESYFIPLAKPGVRIDLFQEKGELNGGITYKFWRSALRKRDLKMRGSFE